MATDEFDPGAPAGYMGGTNDLQAHIDSLTGAVESLTTAMESGGNTRRVTSKGAGGARISGNGTMGAQWGGGNVGGGNGGGMGGGSANGGTLNGMASGGNGGMVSRFIANSGSQMNNMLTMNAFGGQMQNQFGMSAQTAQNIAYGTGSTLGLIGGQSVSDITSGMATLNQLASGNWGSSQMTQGAAVTNMAQYAVQGMSATQASQFAAGLYNPGTAMNMAMMGLPTPLQLGTGKATNLAQFSAALLPRLGMMATNGTYNSQQISALANPYSAQNIDMQNAGWSQSQIQTYSSILGSANTAAAKGHTSMSNVMNLMSQAEGGRTASSREQAQSQLNKWGMSTTTLQKMSTLNQQSISNQSAESSGFNSALQTSVQYLTDLNSALGALLNGPLGQLVGTAKGYGAGAGMASSMWNGSLGGSILGGMGNIGGNALSMGLAGRMLGMGGGAGGAGMLGAGSIAEAALPAAALGAMLYGLNGIHGKGGETLWQAAGPQANGHNTFMQSWPAFGKTMKNWFWNNPGNWLNDINPAMSPTGKAMTGQASASIPQTGGSAPGGSNGASGSSAAARAIAAARGQLGVPYHFGMEQPGVGFDCSSLVQYAYRTAGVNIARTTYQQYADMKKNSVALNKLQPGDIVFQAGSDGTSANPGHEGLYIGGGQVIQAPHTGTDVQITSLAGGGWTSAVRPVGGSTGGSVATTSSGASSSVSGRSNVGMLAAGNSGDADLGLLTNADALLFGGGGPALSTIGATSAGGGTNGGSSGGTNGVSSGLGTSTAGGAVGGTAAQNQQIAKNIIAVNNAFKGWNSGTQWADLVALWTRESSWNANATNPSSGAYGIAQSLHGTRGGRGGNEYNASDPMGLSASQLAAANNGDAASQILWGLNYIKSVYKTPGGAWAHEGSAGWYGDGGTMIVGDRGPEAITVGNGTSVNVKSAKDTQALLSGRWAQPSQAPWQVSATQQLVLDNVPQNAVHMAGGSGVSINFAANSIQVGNGSSQFSGTGTGSDINTMTQQFQQAVEQALSKSQLLSAVRNGVTS